MEKDKVINVRIIYDTKKIALTIFLILISAFCIGVGIGIFYLHL